jgi:hypothetical protein
VTQIPETGAGSTRVVVTVAALRFGLLNDIFLSSSNRFLPTSQESAFSFGFQKAVFSAKKNQLPVSASWTSLSASEEYAFVPHKQR